MKIFKNEKDPPLFTGKLLIKFKKILRNTTQVIVRHRICLQTVGHGETSIPPYNFVAGGITSNESSVSLMNNNVPEVVTHHAPEVVTNCASNTFQKFQLPQGFAIQNINNSNISFHFHQ